MADGDEVDLGRTHVVHHLQHLITRLAQSDHDARFGEHKWVELFHALEIVVAAKPDVFNHNLETVPSNYLTVRPGARYFHSIRLLQRVKELDPSIFTKSGIMVGLGEERNEILQLMDDLRSANVDFMTIGQYLQPSKKHHPVIRFVTPEEFSSFATIGKTKGFLLVASSPLTRSSHHAGDDFARLRAAREAQLKKAS